MKKLNVTNSPKCPRPNNRHRFHFPVAKAAYCVFLCVTMFMMFCQPAFAATGWALLWPTLHLSLQTANGQADKVFWVPEFRKDVISWAF